MTYPIVIPLHHTGGKLRDNTEARFAIRSIEKHFKDDFELAVVGRRLPEWATGIVHIPSTEGLKTALRDAAEKYPDGFFWLYDDTCLLRDTTGEEMKVTPATKGWAKAKTGWARQLENIHQRLLQGGHPAFDFSRPHGPYWFDKAMVDEAFADWPGMKSKFPFESWILSKRDWPRRHGVVRQYYGAFKSTPGNHSHFLNYNDKGNSPQLRAWLTQHFPEPSRFEAPTPEALPPEPPSFSSRVTAVAIYLPGRPRWEAACVQEMAAWGIDVELFAGTDGHNQPPVMPVSREKFRKEFSRDPLPGEIGCFSSHIAVAKSAASLPVLHDQFPDWHLVLEDDALPVDMTADKLLEIAKLASVQGFHIVLLNPGKKNRRGKGFTGILPTTGRDTGTYAYLANKAAMRELSGWLMRHPIDIAIVRSNQLRVGVLYGQSQFFHRAPGELDQAIRHERAAVQSGKPICYSSPPSPAHLPRGHRVKIIHQVWIQGEDALPPEFKANREMWKTAFPDFELVLWDEETAKARWPDYAAATDKCFHHATRADLILARAIRDIGGIATGTDCRPNNVGKLRAILEAVDSMVVLTPGRNEISNGLQWCAEPGHPFWECVCNHQFRQRGRHLSRRSVSSATGPKCYMEAFQAQKWELFVVTAPAAFTRDWNNEWVNSQALIDPGFAASWTKGTPQLTEA